MTRNLNQYNICDKSYYIKMDLNKQSRDATEEKVRGIKEIAPAGTKVISFPRRYDFIGSLL